MPRVLIWDFPTRIFHWLLTIGFFVTAAISLTVVDDHPLFAAHMIVGIMLGVMVLLRIVWGFLGTRYARFSSFLFRPLSLLKYVGGAMKGSEPRSIGHNAGSSYAIFAMLALVLATAITGLMISNGNEAAEELHEIVSYLLMAVVAVHIAGVVWYSVRHRENITLSMFTGRKEASAEEAISSSHPILGLVFLIMISTLTYRLFQNYNQATNATTFPGLGITIPLGESERSDGDGDRD